MTANLSTCDRPAAPSKQSGADDPAPSSRSSAATPLEPSAMANAPATAAPAATHLERLVSDLQPCVLRPFCFFVSWQVGPGVATRLRGRAAAHVRLQGWSAGWPQLRAPGCACHPLATRRHLPARRPPGGVDAGIHRLPAAAGEAQGAPGRGASARAHITATYCAHTRTHTHTACPPPQTGPAARVPHSAARREPRQPLGQDQPGGAAGRRAPHAAAAGGAEPHLLVRARARALALRTRLCVSAGLPRVNASHAL